MAVATIPAPVRVSSRQGASLIPATLAVAGRTVRKFARTPQLIVVGTIQGAMFLLIFRYVFGGAIRSGGLSYVDFLVPGFITTGVLFQGMGGAAGIAEDVETGFFDRLRSLPIPRASVIAGRALADTGMLAWGTAVTSAIGFAVGFRLHGSVLDAVAAFGLCIVFGFSFCWLFMTMGLFARNTQAAQGMSLLIFPLSFVSSAYVPVKTMPGWMQAFANNQPLTVMVDTVRLLTGGHGARILVGHSTSHELFLSLVWCGVLIAVFAPIAVARYRRG
jgi:ABC-2 type transport system permease protein